MVMCEYVYVDRPRMRYNLVRTYVHGRRSVGDGGDASHPLFRVGGQHRNCPPHFLFQKKCEAYSLTQHASLLKAAT